MMEQRPLPELAPEEAFEPRLELVPALDLEPADAEAADAPDDEPAVASHTDDPLKLYVRQIGDGPLLTREEER